MLHRKRSRSVFSSSIGQDMKKWIKWQEGRYQVNIRKKHKSSSAEEPVIQEGGGLPASEYVKQILDRHLYGIYSFEFLPCAGDCTHLCGLNDSCHLWFYNVLFTQMKLQGYYVAELVSLLENWWKHKFWMCTDYHVYRELQALYVESSLNLLSCCLKETVALRLQSQTTRPTQRYVNNAP